MPKRSNDFQRLVFLIKRQKAQGAEVTESKLLIDLITGAKREVDICIEQDIGGHKVVVSLECRDHGRKADVKWVEEMDSKHKRLSTNVLVLVSKKGFTSEAYKVAKAFGIETLALEDVTKDSVTQLFHNLSALFAKVFRMFPTRVLIGVEETENFPAEQVDTLPFHTVFCSDGTEIGTVKELVDLILKSEIILKKFVSQGQEDHKGFVIHWNPPMINNGISLFLQQDQPQILRKITFVHITGEIRFEVSEFSLEQGVLGDVRVAWGTGRFIGQDALLWATENNLGENHLSVSVKNWKSDNVPSWFG